MKVISAHDLVKRYELGRVASRSLREAVTSALRVSRGKRESIFALDDVSFDVANGETLGIIGRNGAGKSTLLKILARITKPTSGTVEIRGRIGSLLEVGTGFHNELTGRENIYLNGAILGMKHAEIDRKFDEIVAFSEIEKFLDTPVKHYSSGMYMRLAFSVAAHLDPEILIVDEVLAVGDIDFQRKCLNKMQDIGESGRTVIFVSHDMNSISRFCSRVMWLDGGKVRVDADTPTAVSEYLAEQSRSGAERSWVAEDAPGNEVALLRKVKVVDAAGNTAPSIDIGSEVNVEMTFDVLTDDKVVIPNLHFYDERGTCLFVTHDWKSEWRDKPRKRATYTSSVRVPGHFLAEGPVRVTAALTSYKPYVPHVIERDAVVFTVVDSLDGDTVRGDYPGPLPGVVRPMLEWKNGQSFVKK